MSNKKSSRIGLGNIISLFGLALLGFFTFMGALMLTSGNMGASIGIALGSVIVLWLILAAAVYCKKADTDFSKWRKLEIVSLIVFLAAAVFPAKYVMQFFSIMTNKEELQQASAADADSLRNMFKVYENAEQSALAVTTTGLQNAFAEDRDLNVQEYYDAASIKNYEDIDSWMLNERRMLLGDTGADGIAPYITYKNNVDSVITQWSGNIKSWDLMAIGRQSKVPGELAPDIVRDLNQRSKAGKLPVINFNSDNGMYQIDNANQVVTINMPELKFEKMITTTGDIKVLNVVLYIVILALIIMQYLLTPRSEKTEIGDGESINNMEGVNRL